MEALVITPFSPNYPDAGHRKRVLESIENLFSLKITDIDLVHIPFEAWEAFNIDEQDSYKEIGVRDVYQIPFLKSIGSPPENGTNHMLDEWFDDILSDFLIRLSRRRRYDLVIVHNVWLSKVLSIFDGYVIKCIETHDMFYQRRDAFARIGFKPDFFAPVEKDELFGLNRADLLIAIAYDEYIYLKNKFPNKSVIYQPPRISKDAKPVKAEKVDKNNVVFGVIGSGHPFNAKGLNDLLLQFKRSNLNYVNLEVAGSICSKVDRSLLGKNIKLLGYVDDVNDFYNRVDVVIAPQFDGSGFPLKVSEALEYGKPLIATKFVNDKLGLNDVYTASTAKELAGEIELFLSNPNKNIRKISDKSVIALNTLYKCNVAALLQWNDILSARKSLNIIELSSKITDQEFATVIGLVSQLSLGAGSYRENYCLIMSDDQREKIHSIYKYMNTRVKIWTYKSIYKTKGELSSDFVAYIETFSKLIMLSEGDHSIKKFLPDMTFCWAAFDKANHKFNSLQLVINWIGRNSTHNLNSALYYLSLQMKDFVNWDPILSLVKSLGRFSNQGVVILVDESRFSQECQLVMDRIFPNHLLNRCKFVSIQDAGFLVGLISLKLPIGSLLIDSTSPCSFRAVFDSILPKGFSFVRLRKISDVFLIANKMVLTD